MILDGKSKLQLRIAGKNLLRTYPQLTGNACIVSVGVWESGWFDTALVERLAPFSVPSIKTDLEEHFPGANLDKNGIVMVGAKVTHRSVLAATLSQVHSPGDSPEKILTAIITKSKSQSIIATAKQQDEALVARVGIKNGGKKRVVTIDLLIQRELTIGDVLDDGHGHTLVVVGFSAKGCFSMGTDILVHPDANILKGLPVFDQEDRAFRTVNLTKVTRRAEEKLAVRSTGMYNLVTQQPTSEHPNQGQKVWIQELAQLGYPQNAVEMATVKSSGLEARGIAYKALLLQSAVPTFKATETHSAHRLATLIAGCGFSMKVENGALSITRMTDREVKERSYGEVKKPETINFRTLKPELEGLFCEAIFGNGRNLECSCGTLQGIRHKGITCVKCGVQVDTHLAPNSRFGHIRLAIPVVHPWLKLQCAETLAQAGIGDTEDILNIINYEKSILDDDDDAKLNDWGVIALEKACKEKGVDISRFLMRNLPVLPTNLRPMVQQDANTFVTSDLNDLYRRLINRNNRVNRLVEIGSPVIIVIQEYQMVQEAVETLMRNTVVTGQFDRLLRSIDAEIEGAARDFYERRVDYSAEAVCVPDPSLPQKTLGVPITIAAELLKPIIMGAMIADHRTKNVKTAKTLLESKTLEPYIEMMSAYTDHHKILATRFGTYIPMHMRLCKGEAIQLNPSDASAFGISFGGEHLTIHLPLSMEAQRELEGGPVPTENGYTTSLASLTCENIAACALSGAPFHLGDLDQLVFSLS